MTDFLRRFVNASSGSSLNLTSVGDSSCERDAVRALAQERTGSDCKVIKFRHKEAGRGTLLEREVLTKELELLLERPAAESKTGTKLEEIVEQRGTERHESEKYIEYSIQGTRVSEFILQS